MNRLAIALALMLSVTACGDDAVNDSGGNTWYTSKDNYTGKTFRCLEVSGDGAGGVWCYAP